MSLKVVFLGMAVSWCPDLGAFCPLGTAVPTVELSCLFGLVQVGGVLLLVHGKMQYEQLVRGEPVPSSCGFMGHTLQALVQESGLLPHNCVWVIFLVIQTCLLGNGYLQEVGPTRPPC